MGFNKESKAIIALDADAIMSLSKPISPEYLTEEAALEGRTLLDLVIHLSERDDVERVVIVDAVVWEAVKQIDGEQIDQRIIQQSSPRNPSFTRIDKYTSEATVIGVDGDVVKEGKHSKLQVQETDLKGAYGDFSRIRTAAHQLLDGVITSEEFWKFAQKDYEPRDGKFMPIPRKNLGEKVISAYLTQELEGDKEAFVISGDLDTRRSLLKEQTKDGAPIGVSNVMGFVDILLSKAAKSDLGILPAYTPKEAKVDLDKPDSAKEVAAAKAGRPYILSAQTSKRGSDLVMDSRMLSEFLAKVEPSLKANFNVPKASSENTWVGKTQKQDDDIRRERGPEEFER